MSELLPLCLIRIWCRANDSWLSFKTVNKDRFLINPSGYFLELPDGSLTQISPRVTFPISERLPAVRLESLSVRPQYGDDARFVSVPMIVAKAMDPIKVEPNLLRDNPIDKLEMPESVNPQERYVLLRAIESGLVSKSGLAKMFELRHRFKTIGSALVNGGICQWESLLGYCLDVRPRSNLDSPQLRGIIERREWELTGEILLTLGIISRTQLEYALKIKREGSQQIGQILQTMGACTEAELEQCLKIQTEVRQASGGEIALIGKVLVNQGIITEEELEDALRNQRIARQSLSRILISMGACTQRDIDDFARVSGVTFQSEIDDVSLGNHLLRTDTITKTHMEEALRIQQRGRQVLGELLVSMGYCTVRQIEQAIQFQRQVREISRLGVEKLGSILIHASKVPPEKVDEAAKLQVIARQPFGAVLIELGACTAEDITAAIEIQDKWRERERLPGDRLGELLVQRRIISKEQLDDTLREQQISEKPLGQILIESYLCSPEQIIEALIERNEKRQGEFIDFIRVAAGGAPPELSRSEREQPSQNRPEAKKSSIVEAVSSWFSRPKGKP